MLDAVAGQIAAVFAHVSQPHSNSFEIAVKIASSLLTAPSPGKSSAGLE